MEITAKVILKDKLERLSEYKVTIGEQELKKIFINKALGKHPDTEPMSMKVIQFNLL